MKVLILSVLLCFYVMAQNNVTLRNIDVVYEENSLHVTWETTLSAEIQWVDYYILFYCEAQVPYHHLMDGELNWGMTYAECWDWWVGTSIYRYFFVLPKRVFPAYSSLMRIGVMAVNVSINNDTTYSRLFLAPDILNRTTQSPTSVVIE